MGKNCSEYIDDCNPNPCKNGGTCTDSFDLPPTCACATGFIGTNCENNNFCDPNPCKNGGICTNRVGNFNCTCNSYFSSDDCSGKSLYIIYL